MSDTGRTERGSSTAEFVVLFPALLLLIALILQLGQLLMMQHSLLYSTQQAGRVLVLRGSVAAEAFLHARHPDAQMTVHVQGLVSCVDSWQTASIFGLSEFVLRAQSCVAR
ncbi:MAG: TadE/TadG family type IV pilus assembly protein [Microbacteriaceae bacterium]